MPITPPTTIASSPAVCDFHSLSAPSPVPHRIAPCSVKSLEALKDAGMLERTEDKDLHVNRYTLTTAGSRASARFCYGHRVISSIDSSTEPAKVNGFPETQIEYHYTMIDVPIWAKSEAIQAAFPEMGKAIKGEGTGKARLSQTLAGWQVPE